MGCHEITHERMRGQGRRGCAPPTPGALFTCGSCRKRTYRSRKTARRAARAIHPEDRMAAYECPTYPGRWHIGHTRPHLRDTYRRRAA